MCICISWPAIALYTAIISHVYIYIYLHQIDLKMILVVTAYSEDDVVRLCRGDFLLAQSMSPYLLQRGTEVWFTKAF